MRRLHPIAPLLGLALLAGGVLSCGPNLIEPRDRRAQVASFDSPFVDAWGKGTVVQAKSSGLVRTKVTTNGLAEPSFLRNQDSLGTPLDLSGKFLKTWVRVDRLDRLGRLELLLSSDGFRENRFSYTIPLFGDPEFGIVKGSTWIPITVGFGSFRVDGSPDRSNIDAVALYVVDQGEGPVQVEWGSIEIIPEPQEGFLSLTFDDGYEDHFTVAAPAMAAHGFAGTAYVMPDQLGTRGFMSVAQIELLYRKYGWDVAAHHAVPFTTMTRSELEDTILGVQRFLDDLDLGDGFRHLAFPLGKHDPSLVMPLVRKHFATARVAGSGVETLPPADPHKLRVINVFDSTTPAEIGEVARRARQNREWAILMFHHLVSKPTHGLEYGTEAFAEAMEAIKESGIRVRPVSEVWRSAL